WEIHTWPAISPRSKTTCAHFPTRPCRKSASSKLCSARFRFTAIYQSPFQTSPSAGPASSARRKSPMEGLSMRNKSVRRFALGLGAFATLRLSACSVNVKKEKDGQDKQVDINTPVGGI